jgi:hypothetical protein
MWVGASKKRIKSKKTRGGKLYNKRIGRVTNVSRKVLRKRKIRRGKGGKEKFDAGKGNKIV